MNSTLNAQYTDTTNNTLVDVIVTASRTEKILGNEALPVLLIRKKTIEQSGSFRLSNILQEQTGLYIANNFGSGVKIQGLGPDYVLILIDGEPLVGRNGGVLDLSRITVNNIKQIEIVKGPSSSLYGSEAMGGVINIITDRITQNTLNANLRYGTYNTVDATVSGSLNFQKTKLSGSINRYSSKGYDFDKTDIGQTVMPFYNYTGHAKFEQQISGHIDVGSSFRYYSEKQNDNYSIGSDIVKGEPVLNEYNINPYVKIKITESIKTVFRGYFSEYKIDTKDYLVSNDSLFYNDFFKQNYNKVENQTDIKMADKNDLNIGIGYIGERLNTSRYSAIQSNTISYAFLQDEYRVSENLMLIGGVRYDRNAAYASHISPKFAIHLKANDHLIINASYGAGFKAPDYRQLYLNFTNNAAGGYTVYGANEISVHGLQAQLDAGILSSITPFGYELKQLYPEYSNGINIGASYTFNNKLFGKMNIFRNDINNMIATKIVAYKTTNAPVYSYFNINAAVTEGTEIELKYNMSKYLKVEMGYQFLITADRAILEKIRAGQVFGKKQGSLTSYQLTRSDYGGLNDQSKHMANLKIFYENQSWFVTTRCLYRSRWGVADLDGNLILNRDDEYTNGNLQINISAGKSFKNGMKLNVGLDNITNYQNQRYLSNLPGITYYITYQINFLNNNRSH